MSHNEPDGVRGVSHEPQDHESVPPTTKDTLMAKILIVIVLGAAMALCCGKAIAQAECKSWSSADEVWSSEPWTGSDAPFHSARIRITVQILHSRRPEEDLAKYEAGSEESPDDAMAAFSLAVAAYNANRGAIIEQPNQYIIAAQAALLRARSPHNYEFDRIRFLLDLLGCYPDSSLRQLADRLLSHTKDDPDVLATAGWCFSAVDMKKATSLLDRAIVLDPKNPLYYNTLGITYYCGFFGNGDAINASYAKLSMLNLQKSLQLTPYDDKTYPYRHVTVHLMTIMEGAIKKFIEK